jgi:hypothetical protein
VIYFLRYALPVTLIIGAVGLIGLVALAIFIWKNL